MAGNILISMDNNNKLKVDYNGDAQTAFGFTDVQLIRTLMAIEGMVVAQTDLSIEEVREILDDERKEASLEATGIV